MAGSCVVETTTALPAATGGAACGLDVASTGHSAPDVFWDHVAYFPQLVQEGALMNLTPLIQKDHLDLSVYYPQLLKPYQYQGNSYGLPKDWDTIEQVHAWKASPATAQSTPRASSSRLNR